MGSQPSIVQVSKLIPEEAHQCFDSVIRQQTNVSLKNERVKSIAIKINLCDYRCAESGATTDPEMLGALIDVLHVHYPDASILILENDATSLETWSAFKVLGIDRIARTHNAELFNVADDSWITKTIPNGVVFQELEVPQILETCDIFINFAKLKTNALTKTTGCLKNIFAFLRIKRKVVLHGNINQVLVDMNKVIKPDLCLVDGYIGMEGMGGPAYGRPKRCELLVSGVNPVSVDACSARIMGFNPRRVKHIQLCSKAGLGSIRYQVETDIPQFEYSQYKFQFEYWDYVLRNLLRSRAGFST
ncbi:MAG: DUF362 domain-containing protein [Leptolyngbya sp. SIO3F4]|nr:DUF362 domain-containing protein [Leptolyngbya sp. SIO3F4]